MTKPSDEEFVTAAFSKLPPVEASAALRRGVRSIPIEHEKEQGWIWPMARIWQSSLGFAGLAAAGLLAGMIHGPAEGSPSVVMTLGVDDGRTPSAALESESGEERDEEDQQWEDTLEGLFAHASTDEWESWTESWDDGATLRATDSLEEIAQ